MPATDETESWVTNHYAEEWPSEGAVPLNTCLRCGVRIFREYLATHDYFHASLESLAG